MSAATILMMKGTGNSTHRNLYTPHLARALCAWSIALSLMINIAMLTAHQD